MLEGSGGSVGLSCDLHRVLGQLRRVPGRAAGNFTGAQEAPERPWEEAGPFKGCWGAQASPRESTVVTSR